LQPEPMSPSPSQTPTPARGWPVLKVVVHRPSLWPVSPNELQGTVSSFDAATRCGSVLLDDGSAVRFDGAAFAAGGLRLLRPGQRVRMEILDGQVVLITILTLRSPG